MARLRTLCFDIGQVLVRFDPQRALERLAALSGREVQTIWQSFASSDLLPRFEKGLLATQDFHSAACRLLGTEIPLAQFCEIWADIFDPQATIPSSLLRALGQHYRLIALSNTDPIHFPYLRGRYDVFDCFEDFILSYQVGTRKPEPEIYRRGIERGGGDAAAILFIDDSAEYVAAAAALGLVARQFHSLPGLLDDLSTLGVWPLPKEG